MRWNRLFPSNVNILIWRALKKRLPNRYNLDKRGIDLDSVRCPLCNNDIEMEDHVFVSGPIVTDLSEKVLRVLLGYGRVWPDMAGSCRDMAGSSWICPGLAGIWPGLAGSWPDMATSSRIWPGLAGNGRFLPGCGQVLPGCGRVLPGYLSFTWFP
ncbi:RNA-directed DNA polymerase, eukaryota, reverse transcriptase zinc-binding domain protein [Tanacetum coccineum]